jgi:hypothetical protein
MALIRGGPTLTVVPAPQSRDPRKRSPIQARNCSASARVVAGS